MPNGACFTCASVKKQGTEITQSGEADLLCASAVHLREPISVNIHLKHPTVEFNLPQIDEKHGQ
jgi:hypothetical protein